MANGKLHISIDASEIMKWIRIGQEQMFIAMTDFEELDEVLNINGICTDEQE